MTARATPLVAMTREMGSLGRDVAVALARRAGGKVVYHELAAPVSNKKRQRKSHVERFLEGKAGIWERLETDRVSSSILTAEETLRVLRESQVAVLRGWGGAQLLKAVPRVARIRICAPMAIRVERILKRLGSDNREAVLSEVRLSDEAHGAIIKRHFGLAWDDAASYDMVLNTEYLSVEDCVDEIEGLMRKPHFAA